MTGTDETTLQRTLNPQPPGSGPSAGGTTGPTGPRGLTGQPGQDGEPGDDGAAIPGPPGKQGASGLPGAPGTEGQDGEEGPPGVPGFQGAAGQPGPMGFGGRDGEDGQDGFQGILLPLTGATSTKAIAAPAAANSTAAFTMQGLAGSITPRRTGNILVSIAGTVTAANHTTVDNGVILQGSYGTGAAPASNDPLAGTQAGALQEFTWPVAPTAVGDVNYGFNVVFLISAAQLGITLWLDLAAKAVTTVSDAPLVNVVVTAVEI